MFCSVPLVSFIQAKMDNQVIGYKDLAAIPKDKAILDVERPDLMMYQPHFNYSPMDRSEVQHTHLLQNDHPNAIPDV